MRQTIFALATAPGRAGLAIVRISGERARFAAASLAGALPSNGRSLRKLRSREGDILDEALILVFEQGHSFTGEEVVELHLHGSPAVVAAVLGELSRIPDLRSAEPGEFTRRALESGKLDLAQVEGLADLINAETEAQRRQGMRVFSGEMGQRVGQWRSSLVRAMALIEATIDFADEEVPVDVVPEVQPLLQGVLADMEREIAGSRIAERIREGFEVAIVGAPNVGKSTLLNFLAGREAAITSERAGTTRDVIEVRLVLDGLPVTLLDTAGIRDAGDEIEELGIARGRQRADAADLRIHLVEREARPVLDVQPGDIVVQTKADITGEGISGLTGRGIEDLVSRVAAELSQRAALVGVAMRQRHREAMVRALAGLWQAMELLPEADERGDLIAEELRNAVSAIDMLVGRVDVEDVLDEIFSSFCIGK
jgi:tRNA modification GTPase